MRPYIGTKLIDAEPCTRGEFGLNDGQSMPTEKLAAPGYRVRYQPDGYESWSPRAVFEAAYRPVPETFMGKRCVVLAGIERLRADLHAIGGTDPTGDRFGSAHLTLAFRHLEDLESRVRRHLGED